MKIGGGKGITPPKISLGVFLGKGQSLLKRWCEEPLMGGKLCVKDKEWWYSRTNKSDLSRKAGYWFWMRERTRNKCKGERIQSKSPEDKYSREMCSSESLGNTVILGSGEMTEAVVTCRDELMVYLCMRKRRCQGFGGRRGKQS